MNSSLFTERDCNWRRESEVLNESEAFVSIFTCKCNTCNNNNSKIHVI